MGCHGVRRQRHRGPPATRARLYCPRTGRSAGIDDEPATKCPPAQQHPEPHLVPPGERQLDGEAAAADHHLADDGPALDLAVARPHGPHGQQVGLGLDGLVHVPLAGVEDEPDPRQARPPGALDDGHVPGVQRRRPGTGVDLGLDDATPSSGRATHSRQPMVVAAIRPRRYPAGPAPLWQAGARGRAAAPAPLDVPGVGPRVRASAGWSCGAGWRSLMWLPGDEAPAPVLFVVALVASMAVHEGAHAWAAHSLGYRVDWVVIGGLAGMTAFAGRGRPPPGAGRGRPGRPGRQRRPGAGAGRRVATLERGTVEMGTVEFVIALNALAVVVNLVPVGRTDGALLVRGLFRHARSRRRGPEG